MHACVQRKTIISTSWKRNESKVRNERVLCNFHQQNKTSALKFQLRVHTWHFTTWDHPLPTGSHHFNMRDWLHTSRVYGKHDWEGEAVGPYTGKESPRLCLSWLTCKFNSKSCILRGVSLRHVKTCELFRPHSTSGLLRGRSRPILSNAQISILMHVRVVRAKLHLSFLQGHPSTLCCVFFVFG